MHVLCLYVTMSKSVRSTSNCAAVCSEPCRDQRDQITAPGDRGTMDSWTLTPTYQCKRYEQYHLE